MKKQKSPDYNQHIIEVFKGVTTAVNILGADEFIKKINDVLIESDNSTSKHMIAYILHHVADTYNITVQDITESYKRGIVDEARCLCYVFFNKYVLIDKEPMSPVTIGKFFKRDKANVYKRIKEILVLVENNGKKKRVSKNPNFNNKKFSEKCISNYYDLDRKIIEYKKLLNTPNTNSDGKETHSEKK
jgi:hypothetical protein